MPASKHPTPSTGDLPHVDFSVLPEIDTTMPVELVTVQTVLVGSVIAWGRGALSRDEATVITFRQALEEIATGGDHLTLELCRTMAKQALSIQQAMKP